MLFYLFSEAFRSITRHHLKVDHFVIRIIRIDGMSHKILILDIADTRLLNSFKHALVSGDGRGGRTGDDANVRTII